MGEQRKLITANSTRFHGKEGGKRKEEKAVTIGKPPRVVKGEGSQEAIR